MSEKPEQTDPETKQPGEAGLNPALRQRTERVHDTSHPSPPPAESASVQHEEGRAWPMVWLLVAVAGVLVGLWLIFF